MRADAISEVPTRIVKKLGCSWSSRCAMIVAQHSGQSLAPFNLTVTFVNVSVGQQQAVSEPLMISLAVVVAHILCERVTKRCLSHEDHPTQTFFLYRANKPFRERVQIR